MLLQLRDYIKRGQVVSMEQLTREFHIDKQALQPMLDIWVTKGVIKPCQGMLACGRRCSSSCNVNTPVFYQWL
ncbi:MAG: FeoC-like transcriptional regulator [Legionellaceae bacterium]|nr:FeoC-like transcriptional regulator [Legionellaceae bacterium]